MVAVNPEIPNVQDPTWYLKLPHSIEQPHFQSTFASALKEGGNLIEASLKEADKTVETISKDDAYDTANAERQKELEGLQNLKEGFTKVGTTPNPNPTFDPLVMSTTPMAGQKDTLFPTEASPTGLPKDLKNLPGQIQSIDSARANGKLSPTDYYMRMDQLASEVRSRYPNAYRDVIDKEFAKVTGGIPANMAIASLRQDINAAATSKDKEKEHVLNMIKDNPSPGWEKVYDDVASGRIPVQQGLTFVSKPMAEKYRLNMEDLAIKNAQAKGNLTKEDAVRNIQQHADSSMKLMFHGIATIDGWKPDDIFNTIRDINAGRLNPTKDQQEALSRLPLAWKAEWEKEVRARVMASGAGGIAGQEEVEKIIAAGGKVFDNMHSSFMNKDYGTVMRYMQLMPALEADAKYKLWNDKDLGKYTQLTTTLKTIMPDSAFQKLFDEKLMGPVNEATDAFLKRGDFYKMNMLTPADDPRLGSAMSLKESLQRVKEDAERNNIPTNRPTPVISKTVEHIFSLVDSNRGGLLDPEQSPQAKRNMALALFDPKRNEGVLKLINKDQRDPTTGALIPGRESWFWRMTRPAVAAEIHKLGADVEAKYLDHIKRTWEQDIAKKNLQDLAAMPTGSKPVDTTFGPGAAAGDNWKVIYHQGAGEVPPRFAVELNGKELIPNSQGKEPWMSKNGNLRPIVDTIQGINKGLNGYYGVATGLHATEKDPNTIDKYVIDTLIDGLPQGTDLTNLAKIPGIPGYLINSINAAHAENEKQGQKKVPSWQ